MDLFDIDSNYNIIIKPEALLLKPFKKVQTAFRSNHTKVFAFIYYVNDHNSDFKKNYKSTEIREVVKHHLDLRKVDIDNSVITDAEALYKELQQTKSIKLLDAASNAMDKILQYFEEIDINAIPEDKRDDSVSKIMKNATQITDVIKAIETARKAVEQETLEKNRIKGNKKIRAREIPKQ